MAFNRSGWQFVWITAVIGVSAAPVDKAAGASTRDEIVVTARLREEDLQQVPVSISTFTAEELAKAGIRDIQDLANFTSNFTFENGTAARRSIPTIRGLGAPDLSGEDNNVGVFVDGIYINAREGINVQMLDIERVEVMKGPQGALYGRSTFAGAINYVTRKPTEEIELGADITAGEHDLYQIDAFVSGPVLANETLFGRFAVGYERDDGTYENGALGGGLGGYENYAISGALRFVPSDEIELILNASYYDQDINSAALGRYPNNCGENNPTPGRLTLFYTCGEVPGAETRYDLGLSPEAYSMRGDQVRLTAHLDWDTENFTFSSISAYTELEQDSLSDLDRTQGGESGWGHTFVPDDPDDPFDYIDIPNAPVDGCFACFPFEENIIAFSGEIPQYFNENSTGSSEYWSQELRLTSVDDQRLRWMGGLFFYSQESDNQTGLTSDLSQVIDELPDNYQDGTFLFFDGSGGGDSWLRSDFSPNNVFKVGAVQNIVQLSTRKTRHWAAFGSLDYDVTDTLTLTTELRYTHEQRELIDVFDSFFGTGEILNDRFSTRDTFLDPRLIVRYSPTDEAMIYASAARGHRSGGCNPGTIGEGLEPFKCYKSESNWTYELGTKTSWLDDRLILNAAIFFVDWTDVQFRTQFPELGGLSTITTNLGDLESKGAELEVIVNPVDGLVLSASYGYADPKFKDSQLDFGTSTVCLAEIFEYFGTDPCELDPTNPANTREYVNIQGTQLRRTSKRTFNSAIDYEAQFNADWDWYTRWDYRHQSKQFQEQHNAIWVGSRNLVNARIGLRTDEYDVSFWVRNLTDDETPLSAYAFTSDLNGSDSVTTVVNSERRRWGVTASLRF